MRYFWSMNSYWLIWWATIPVVGPWWSMACGLVGTMGLTLCLWRYEFGTWWFR